MRRFEFPVFLSIVSFCIFVIVKNLCKGTPYQNSEKMKAWVKIKKSPKPKPKPKPKTNLSPSPSLSPSDTNVMGQKAANQLSSPSTSKRVSYNVLLRMSL
jgi:hypothetical protein